MDEDRRMSSDSESSSEEEEEEESLYTEGDGTKSRSVSTGMHSSYTDGDDLEQAAAATTLRDSAVTEEENDGSVSTYKGGESVSTYEGGDSVSTYGDTATKSKGDSRGMHSSYGTLSLDETASNATESQERSPDPVPIPTFREHSEADKELKQFDEIVERVLANDPSFKQVVLDNRKQIIGNQHGSETLWNALVGNNYVERLSLRSCSITDEEAASLSLALVDNTTITHVWLGDNDITSEGVECEWKYFSFSFVLFFSLLFSTLPLLFISPSSIAFRWLT